MNFFENRNIDLPQVHWQGAPFWALNGNLTPDEIRRQIRGFKNVGFGGFFLHARTGLQTEYLSEKWFECIAAAIDEAEKNGLKAWLYDEDRFPSGFGGGKVTCDERFRAKGVFLEMSTATETLPENTVAVFAAEVDGNQARNVRKMPLSVPELNGGETALIFYTDTIKCSSWYNGFTYLDTLNPEAVQKFITLTHLEYEKRFKDKFGTVIPGMFTDEPRYGFVLQQPGWDVEERCAMPWTYGFFEKFQQRFGYDVIERLPELFFEVENCDSVAPRLHYLELMEELFLESYAKPAAEWCERNGLLYTGHVVGEDSLSYQAYCNGSAMRYYEYMGMPGIDLLTEHHRSYQSAKQLSSAAHQFGKKRRLTESYGCTGWDFPIAGFRALGDWQYALGVNFRCQHLAFYTMEGEAKRDYPCTVGLHSNTPEQFLAMENYFARLGETLSCGDEQRNILVISAVESAWTMIHNFWRSEEKTLDFDRKFNALSLKLLANQLDFDYGDEDIISRYAKVVDVDGRAALQVGMAKYFAVTVPWMITIRKSTLDILREFRAAGGTVLVMKPYPTHIDGWKEEADFSIFEDVSALDDLVEKLEPFRIVGFSSKDFYASNNLLYHLRHADDRDTLFICNTGHRIDEGNEDGAKYLEIGVMERKNIVPDVEIKVKSSHDGAVIEFDPATGKYYACQAEYSDGAWTFSSSFSRLQSRMYIFCKDAAQFACSERENSAFSVTDTFKAAPETWDIELSEKNVIVFDHFTSKLNSEPEYVLDLDDKLRMDLGIAVRDFVMVQPWCRKNNDSKGGEVEISAKFDCEYLPHGDIFLVIETPGLYTAQINGRNLELNDCGAWHEPAWRKCPLPAEYMQKGKNTFTIKTFLSAKHPGLEAVFLIGDFGVKYENGEMTIIEPAVRLHAGNWVKDGLPFYAGNVTYHCDVELPSACKGRIRINEFYGTPAEITIDDGKKEILFFSPDETAVLELPQKFKLSVTITGSLRNACGPFFCGEKSPRYKGPMQFKNTASKVRELVEYGIYAPIEILIGK